MKTEWQGEVRLRFADPARTVVDILDTPRLGGGIRHGAEILAAYLDDHDPTPSSNTATASGTGPCSSASATSSRRSSEDEPGPGRGLSRAGLGRHLAARPRRAGDGRRVARWGLRINVRVEPEEPS